ncbi:glycoside hydrolase family 5 protein [Roseibium sp. Sym1]|uniref:glycoside hydrolase family 5 protein n=1 Tax=Roseibium sp. Sym1 TaxID=3016006 RepID=UPI0022B3BF94|nr:cellulase family glycosylhydrolase [Roseibium sp. Sym1]
MIFPTGRGRLWSIPGRLLASVLALCLTAGLAHVPTGSPASGIGSALAASDGDAVVPHFRRGVNLSRLQNYAYRDPERPGKYLWPPFQGDLARITDPELERLTALGLDFVRLPVDAGVFLAADGVERRLLLDDLKTLVVRLLDAGLGVMVDIHPSTYQSDWTPRDILAEADGPRLKAYEGFLVDVAKRLRDLPPDRVALELMNEPQSVCYREDGEDWSVTQKKLYDSVRGAAPDLPVVLTPGCWRSLEELEYMSLEGYDDKIIFDFHFYDPYYLTHQSLPWSMVPLRYIAGLTYPWTSGSIESAEVLTKQRLAALEKSGVDLPDDAFARAMEGVRDYYNRKRPDLAFIEERFDTLAQWSDKYDIAPERIVLGEFSAIRPPEGLPDDGSRLAWIRDVRSVTEILGFGWAFWDYDEGFGMITDNATRTLDPGIVEALGLDPDALSIPVRP